MRAIRALFLRHGAESTPEGRSLRLLRAWLSPAQRAHFAEKGFFEVIGGDTGKQYRIYAGAGMNVCEVDEKGRPTLGICFVPVGELLIGDVMLSQKIALENCERGALAVARRFVPNVLGVLPAISPSTILRAQTPSMSETTPPSLIPRRAKILIRGSDLFDRGIEPR
jgi:hypothetical protein